MSARRTPARWPPCSPRWTPLDVDTKIANALLGLATEAFVAAQLASRDASITALQGAKADATLLASYAANAALSASKTALQSALDAILAELAALQLSGSGVVNAPAWAGFTTWELLRGSSVVRNLHFVAPLSAALANGDDTLSIAADCYSTVGTDAAITAALLAYYTSSQVDTLLGDYRTGAAQDADAGGHRGRAAGLPDGPGPGRVHHQPNHLGAGGVPLSRRPGHGNGLEHRRRAAQLLHHCTSRRPPRRQARSHGGGLGPANSNALSGRWRGRRGGGRHRRADPGPHGRLTVKLDGSPQQRLQRGPGHAHRGSERGRLHPDPGGEPVEHRAHLQLDPGPRAPLRLPLPARQADKSTTHCTAASWATRAPGAGPRCTSQCRQTEWRSCTLVRTSRRRVCPTKRQECTASRSWTQPWRPATRRRRTRRPRPCSTSSLTEGPTTSRWQPWARCCWSPRSPR